MNVLPIYYLFVSKITRNAQNEWKEYLGKKFYTAN